MKNLIITILTIISFSSIFAQQADTLAVHDPAAKKILDRVSKKYKAYNTLRLYFLYQMYDNKDTTNRMKEHYKGYLYIKGQNKYKLIVPELEVFSDGVKIYTLNKKDKELTITLYDPESQSVLSPQKLLFIYNKGFKYLYRGQATFDTKSLANGKVVPKKRTMYIVDLYPEHPRKSQYSIIRIWIDKNTDQIVSIKYQGRNGIDYVVDILQQTPNIKIPALMFTFDRKRLPKGVEITDMTEN